MICRARSAVNPPPPRPPVAGVNDERKFSQSPSVAAQTPTAPAAAAIDPAASTSSANAACCALTLTRTPILSAMFFALCGAYVSQYLSNRACPQSLQLVRRNTTRENGNSYRPPHPQSRPFGPVSGHRRQRTADTSTAWLLAYGVRFSLPHLRHRV